MSDLGRESLRNVAMISSAGAGKTSLAEAILFATGDDSSPWIDRTSTTVSDFEPEELHRHSSVSTSLLRCSWKHTTINLVDPPGALNLLGEAIMALRAVDAVILVVGGSSGIRSELVKVWSRIKALGLPTLLFLNELDKENASLQTKLWRCVNASLESTPCRCRCPLPVAPSSRGWWISFNIASRLHGLSISRFSRSRYLKQS